MDVNPTANRPQGQFLALPNKFRAFVSGFGGGKTWCGSQAKCMHYYKHPKINQGYFAPSYPQIRDIFYPTVEEVAHTFGLSVDIKEGNKEVHFYRGRDYKGTTICRSMERPGTIIGFKIGHALVDEFDTLEKAKATTAWRKIIARMRHNIPGLKNGVDITTTPEGFRKTYDLFVKALVGNPDKAKNYGLVQASTYENEINLPEDYIPSLLEDYPAELIDAYINGQFVNLTSGSVYPSFNRNDNHTDATIAVGEDLHIGMDFNVNHMAAIVHVIRSGRPYAVAEHLNVRDTPAMIDLLKEEYAAHNITIYPDASGASSKSVNASISDISLLREYFRVKARKANPKVRQRIVSMNAMFRNALGDRRYLVNTNKCPGYTLSLEQQAYNKFGDPEKTHDVDHPNDAAGYFIDLEFSAVGKPSIRVV
jgi:hypothetical protein